MIRYHAIVSYDGSRYFGFQAQNEALGIQEVIEKALKNMTQTEIKIHSAGRTDKGVHALAQSFHFDSYFEIENKKFIDALNKRLPLDIRILSIRKTNHDFHARHSAISKRYIYKMSKKPTNAFQAFYYHYDKHADIRLMKEAAYLFQGTHDFEGFSVKVIGKPTIKTIYSVIINETKNNISFEFHGNGFLKYMVRSIMGTIIEVGKGMKTLEDIKINLTYPDRKLSGKTAPPNGLYLKKVYYKKTKDWYNVDR
jgi:tRNA pseudouridine38-40 synthase